MYGKLNIICCWIGLSVFLAIYQNGVCQNQRSQADKLLILYRWAAVDFTYPSEIARVTAIQQGLFEPKNVVVLDSDIYMDNVGGKDTSRAFVTMPRFRPGIPATLATVTNQKRGHTYLLSPFPDWESQSIVNCDGPTSVYRIQVDTCGRLWVSDTGRVDTFINPRRACQPKVLIYDLRNNDRLIDRYEFPDGVVTIASNLATLVTDIRGRNCQQAVAYIADTNSYGIVVYDMARRSSWRVEHNYFYPFPIHGTMTVAGITFDLMDGVFGLAVGPLEGNDRMLYFHSLASYREGWVPTSVLRNYTALVNAGQTDRIRSSFRISDEARDSQATLEVINEQGAMIFAELTKLSLGCWNVRSNTYARNTLSTIYQNHDTLQFVSGMKLLSDGDTLLITSSKLQEYIAGNLNTTDFRFHMLAGSVRKLLEGSQCLGRQRA